MNNPYEIKRLDANQVSFTRSRGGVFHGIVEGVAYDELVVYRTFPFLYTTSYLSIRDRDKKELGVIEHIDDLDDESSAELLKELQFRYFLPRVIKINSIKQKADMWIWELLTNLGPTRITMRNLHEYMQYPDEDRIIITDINGKRCEIVHWKALDRHSVKQLKDVV